MYHLKESSNFNLLNVAHKYYIWYQNIILICVNKYLLYNIIHTVDIFVFETWMIIFSSDSPATEGQLVGIGNPLLDISAIVDEDLLKKYDLHPDDAIMAEEKHMPLYKELTEKYVFINNLNLFLLEFNY